jgi:hypothetical protein
MHSLVWLKLYETSGPNYNLIQEFSTVHNNVLISQFKDNPGAEIRLWYAQEMDKTLYQW